MAGPSGLDTKKEISTIYAKSGRVDMLMVD
jgi:hypothetical protein